MINRWLLIPIQGFGLFHVCVFDLDWKAVKMLNLAQEKAERVVLDVKSEGFK